MTVAGQPISRQRAMHGGRDAADRHTLAAYLYRLPDLTHPYRYVATNSTKAAGS